VAVRISQSNRQAASVALVQAVMQSAGFPFEQMAAHASQNVAHGPDPHPPV
jgi:hypothetical protein